MAGQRTLPKHTTQPILIRHLRSHRPYKNSHYRDPKRCKFHLSIRFPKTHLAQPLSVLGQLWPAHYHFTLQYVGLCYVGNSGSHADYSDPDISEIRYMYIMMLWISGENFLFQRKLTFNSGVILSSVYTANDVKILVYVNLVFTARAR